MSLQQPRLCLGAKSGFAPAVAVVTLALVTACASDPDGERVGGAALMGAGLGIPGGPIGIAVGAGAGALVGVLVPKDVLEGSSQDTGR